MQEVKIYIETDTKAPKVREGHYAYTLECLGHIRDGTGCVKNGTYYRLVLTAMIKALERMLRHSKIDIKTDCKHIIYSHQNVQNWERNGWKKQDGDSLANADLWKRLYELEKGHEITLSFAGNTEHSVRLRIKMREDKEKRDRNAVPEDEGEKEDEET